MKKQSSYKALADYSPLYPYFIIPFRRQTIGPLFRYLSTVIKDFFLGGAVVAGVGYQYVVVKL